MDGATAPKHRAREYSIVLQNFKDKQAVALRPNARTGRGTQNNIHINQWKNDMDRGHFRRRGPAKLSEEVRNGDSKGAAWTLTRFPSRKEEVLERPGLLSTAKTGPWTIVETVIGHCLTDLHGVAEGEEASTVRTRHREGTRVPYHQTSRAGPTSSSGPDVDRGDRVLEAGHPPPRIAMRQDIARRKRAHKVPRRAAMFLGRGGRRGGQEADVDDPDAMTPTWKKITRSASRSVSPQNKRGAKLGEGEEEKGRKALPWP
ncbi:hypothetical protein DFH07DRAFT_941020 [Mycena maculata]|uniref:Uncharacterized protein n=1 Tax=Mycena maculata TaxID=230809 RepID=A0AAD7J2Z8_9AGAR|nr:hypothetical protein DFH07DRAFT_941020 [Mycena maculata]